MTTLIKIAKVIRPYISVAMLFPSFVVGCLGVLFIETDFLPFMVIGWPIFLIAGFCLIITLILVVLFFWPDEYFKRLKQPRNIQSLLLFYQNL